MPPRDDRHRCCVICGDDGALHLHHVIPRAYGGSAGPVVPLCNGCHEGVHHCANLETSIADYVQRDDCKRVFPLRGHERAHKLVMAIRRAKSLVGSADRPARITLIIPHAVASRLQAMADAQGVSRTRMIHRILSEATSFAV